MNINIHNYEAYFLDYHEGTLSLELVKELMEFLSRHPELKEELESFEAVTLNAPLKITYEEKENLKKYTGKITSSSFDEYAVEYVEGILPGERQKELAAFINLNPHFEKEFELYKKTKLTPDTAIVFDDKASLKKKESKPVIWYWSAAASVAILIGAFFMVNRNESPNKKNVVQHILTKDSSTVAHQSAGTKDSINPGPQNKSVLNRTKNHSIIAYKIKQNKQNKTVNSVPDPVKDSSAIAVVKPENNEHMEPVKQPDRILPANDSGMVASKGNEHTTDTSSIKEPLIIVEAPQSATIAIKKKGSFLIALAKLTCKGLHKATGQHIELEEHYAADTSTVVAYQLDLGRKKIEFPVRD